MSPQVTEVLMPRPRQQAFARQTAVVAPPPLALPRLGASALRSMIALATPTLVAAAALWVHRALPSKQNPAATHHYPAVLAALVLSSPVLAVLFVLLRPARRWLRGFAPIFAAFVAVACAWDVITLKLALLPLPYFPGPDAVLVALVDDWRRILECAWRSLLLLTGGYAMGAVAGLVTGVLIGWFPLVRYWVMPFLKVIGPVPATALIPLSIMLFPSSFMSGAALIALAVWFPMTMLTSSGIANVRVSHLEVARTLGAGRGYLIFRVALPSALPNVFIGMFMGLGAAFLTLIAAEAVGVKSGLGWYIDLGRNYGEYDMIYASLLVTAAFFSAIMTLLFKVRDRVLFWQKGVIKW